MRGTEGGRERERERDIHTDRQTENSKSVFIINIVIIPHITFALAESQIGWQYPASLNGTTAAENESEYAQNASTIMCSVRDFLAAFGVKGDHKLSEPLCSCHATAIHMLPAMVIVKSHLIPIGLRG